MKASRKKLKNINQQQQEESIIQWIRNAMPEIKEEDIYIKDGNIHISNESIDKHFLKREIFWKLYEIQLIVGKDEFEKMFKEYLQDELFLQSQ